MRIATWNLERGGRRGAAFDRQRAVLDSISADITVLTEPPWQLSTTCKGLVAAPRERQAHGEPEAWVAIQGDGVEPVSPAARYGRLAVAARTTALREPVVVYGSVLPWLAAPRQAAELLATPSETYAEMFKRVLREQVADVRALQLRFPGELLVWAGDFNQTLAGANWGGSNRSRALLECSIETLGLDAWNQRERHALDGLCAIDLICGPNDRTPIAVTRIEPAADGPKLSDHAGYVVEV